VTQHLLQQDYLLLPGLSKTCTSLTATADSLASSEPCSNILKQVLSLKRKHPETCETPNRNHSRTLQDYDSQLAAILAISESSL
jgi:hypothetical protein